MALQTCFLCHKDFLNHRSRFGFCSGCAHDMGRVLKPRSLKLEEDSFHSHFPLLSFGSYEGRLRDWIIHLKSSHEAGALESKLCFIEELLDYRRKDLESYKFRAVVPAPSHFLRHWQGSDLVRLLSLQVAKSLKAPVLPFVLKRKARHWTDYFLSQKDKGRDLRSEILIEALSPKDLGVPKEYRRVLLVDDLSSSGETLKNCALSLQKQGWHVEAALVIAQRKLRQF